MQAIGTKDPAIGSVLIWPHLTGKPLIAIRELLLGKRLRLDLPAPLEQAEIDTVGSSDAHLNQHKRCFRAAESQNRILRYVTRKCDRVSRCNWCWRLWNRPFNQTRSPIVLESRRHVLIPLPFLHLHSAKEFNVFKREEVSRISCCYGEV